MTENIKFVALNKYDYDVMLKPYPAHQAIPEWWRAATPYDISEENPNGKKLIVEDRKANATFKKCTPMLDALTSGYIIPLWTDVLVREVGGFPRITWRTGRDVFSLHGEGSTKVEAPIGYRNDIVFKYHNTWIPRTPKGYSSLIVSPFGHKQSSPFSAIPAVIDSDKSTLEIIPPMWIKKDFEGVVEKGTPLVQIIPFKRENWKATFSFYEDGEYEKIEEKNFSSTLVNHYVKNHWDKKSYK